MSIVRNSIEVVGIAEEKELLVKTTNNNCVQYSETETFFIPKGKTAIKNIVKVVINIETNSNRVINTSLGKTIVTDGTKYIKIIYSEKGHSSKTNNVNFEVPFNCFTQIDEDQEIDKVKIYVLDAYFALVENRKLYSHIVYMVEYIYDDILDNEINEDNNVFSGYIDETNVEENSVIEEEKVSFKFDEIEYSNEPDFDMNKIVNLEVEDLEDEDLLIEDVDDNLN